MSFRRQMIHRSSASRTAINSRLQLSKGIKHRNDSRKCISSSIRQYCIILALGVVIGGVSNSYYMAQTLDAKPESSLRKNKTIVDVQPDEDNHNAVSHTSDDLKRADGSENEVKYIGEATDNKKYIGEESKDNKNDTPNEINDEINSDLKNVKNVTNRVDVDNPDASAEDVNGTKINIDDMTKAQVEVSAEEELIVGFQLLRTQSIPTTLTPDIMKTNFLSDHLKKRILVTGGAGFVGSHLVDKLMMEGHEVIVLDNFFTGQKRNIEHWIYHPNFSYIVHDVINPILLEVDQIYHLACPASPPHYQYNPIKTVKTSTQGTLNMLGLAKRVNARMLLASTSEIYGDPLQHPQSETYWGNVNTIGPRSCYDEGKRVAETMMYAFQGQEDVDVRVARIFNTFGPRMHPNDGRVVSNFIIQALQGLELTVYGDGKQSRSFQYVADLVEGLYSLMNGNYSLPINLGNPEEYTVERFANHIRNITKSKSEVKFLEASRDDPHQRKPDISTAKEKIQWEPRVSVDTGLELTIEYFQTVLKEQGKIVPTGSSASKPKNFS
mmetsp:Transcript_1023/g.1351  ORF Transcript_1023/g.1351 Transcript_1023/m.1351 type:complete len:552 (-) Transcript_1023:125-1780(-)